MNQWFVIAAIFPCLLSNGMTWEDKAFRCSLDVFFSTHIQFTFLQQSKQRSLASESARNQQ